MTEIRMRRENGKYAVKVDGHAGYHPGNDIVCASVSTVVQMFYNGLLNCGAEGPMIMGDGKFHFRLTVQAEEKEAADRMFETAAEYLTELERQYPENVNVGVGAECF